MNSVQFLASTGSELREALGRQDWTRIAELDGQCRQAVEQAMLEVSDDESILREHLQGLLDLYKELVTVCQQEQARLAEEMVSSQRGKQGAKVYQLFS